MIIIYYLFLIFEGTNGEAVVTNAETASVDAVTEEALREVQAVGVGDVVRAEGRIPIVAGRTRTVQSGTIDVTSSGEEYVVCSILNEEYAVSLVFVATDCN